MGVRPASEAFEVSRMGDVSSVEFQVTKMQRRLDALGECLEVLRLPELPVERARTFENDPHERPAARSYPLEMPNDPVGYPFAEGIQARHRREISRAEDRPKRL